MDRCPNCRARLGDGPQCRRCGMELGPLREVEHGFDVFFTHTLRRLAEGDTTSAAEHLRKALRLRRDPLAKKIMALLQATPLHGPFSETGGHDVTT